MSYVLLGSSLVREQTGVLQTALTASMMHALPSPPPTHRLQVLSRSRSPSSRHGPLRVEILTRSGPCLEINKQSTRSKTARTHDGALFVSNARACLRPTERAYTISTLHSTPQTCTCARACEHSEPRPPAFCAHANHACFVGASQVNARRDFGALQ